ncbi:hypothetical protein EOD41_19325 [Mucilaginibacter limnophilus]|uniref:Outer membrane protein beta-barrel domain-containing protein n=1 Tax=Mucilaginibacter limnophilus TaxID=1932778 RepID=A0A3S2UZI4_9SPHI|nr:hypothetical protein [Mucilaginibacter limnophilus]RVT97161.1 hypothetical protein EOD41_19325 [Mucilaginibacter limnophilus]
MKEDLENDLKRRISEVFDNYEDNTADEGWMLLREKFPAQAKHRGVARLWWTSAAAVILLFLGVGLWLNYESENQQVQITKTSVKKPQQQPVHVTEPAVTDKTEVEAETVEQAAAPTEAENLANNNFKPAAPSLSVQPRPENTVQVITQQPVKKESVKAPAIAPEAPNGQVTDPVYAVTQPVDTKPAPVTQTTSVTAQKQPAMQPVIVQQQPATAKSSIMALLEKDSKPANNRKEESSDKAVKLGLYAATYVNYAKGSDNRVNVGAGLTSDFRITKNLKLSTGIAIAQNSFNYNSGAVAEVPAVAVQQSVALTAMKDDNKMFNGIISSPSLQNYNASLLGLDIPVNLKYEFAPGKSDTYVSAGVSSGTFLNENYTYKYGYSGAVSGSLAQPIGEKITEGFGNFYLARTLNVAFGVGYPLGKSNTLVIEPFLKYPLDGMGAQQIKFGAGGINLKLNFQTKRK